MKRKGPELLKEKERTLGRGVGDQVKSRAAEERSRAASTRAAKERAYTDSGVMNQTLSPFPVLEGMNSDVIYVFASNACISRSRACTLCPGS